MKTLRRLSSLTALFCLALTSAFAGPVNRINPNGATSSYGTIQAALNQAAPGDIIRVNPGVYSENLKLKTSGTPTAFITLEAAPGATVVIDGAYAALQSPGNLAWQQNAAGWWYCDTAYFGDDPAPPNATSYAIGTWASVGSYASGPEVRLLAAYAGYDAFLRAPRGAGTYREKPDPVTKNARVYLRLEGNGVPQPDPRAHTINLGKSVGVLRTNNQSYWRIRNLDIRHGGWAGVYIDGSTFSGIELENLTVRNSFRGISTDEVSGTGVKITGCKILNNMPHGWTWAGAYDAGTGADPLNSGREETSPYRGVGIKCNASGTSDAAPAEISNCTIRGQWDGLSIEGRFIRAHHNTIHNINDDAVELESSISEHLHFNNNLIYDAFVGISVTSNRPGPVYVYRNVVETWRKADGVYGYGIKSGVDWARAANAAHVTTNIKFFHNTFAGKRNLWEKIDDPAPDSWHAYDFHNNLFYAMWDNYTFRGYSDTSSGSNNIWQGNVYTHDTGDWRETTFIQDVLLGSRFVNARTDDNTGLQLLPSDLRLKTSATALLGSAIALPAGWPDSVPTTTPGRDRGAWENEPSVAATQTIGSTP